jgi:hypothetical protein
LPISGCRPLWSARPLYSRIIVFLKQGQNKDEAHI